MEKYFSTHRHYFISVATATSSIGAASMKEKEMVASLFCKLASLLRYKFSAFGSDTRIAVRCLQVLVRATDAKSLVKNCFEFIRTSMLMFFNNAADDLSQCLSNLYEVSIQLVLCYILIAYIYFCWQMKYNLLRGTHLKTSSSLTYVQMVLLPVLTALFDHLSVYEFGSDLLRNTFSFNSH